MSGDWRLSLSQILGSAGPGAPSTTAWGRAAEHVEACQVEAFQVGRRQVEKTLLHVEFGPVVFKRDGSIDFMVDLKCAHTVGRQRVPVKKWADMTSSEQKVLCMMTAQENSRLRRELGDDFWSEDLRRFIDTYRQASAEDELAEGRARVEERCRQEAAREPVRWWPVSMDTVVSSWSKCRPGTFYGMPFPHTEAMLAEFGPDWLTTAFHRAGTLDRKNRVVKIILEEKEEKVELKAGNNAGKFFFEVRYAKMTADLHTKLFAKIPFPCSGETKSDRIGASVYKQPMDFLEINTYRLWEAALPFRIPKYYFADISNETSNYLMITEQVQFAGIRSKRERRLLPYEIEGPYEKCKDWMLQRDPREYYLLLLKTNATLAAHHKIGNMGSERFIADNFGLPASPANFGAWGLNQNGSSGEDPVQWRKKVDAAVRFFSQTAKALFPSYVIKPTFQNKFVNAVMTFSAYRSEINYWCHSDGDYVALTHGNLNVDNAWFWSKDDGALDVGVFDFGGFSVGPIGHRLWWCVYAADFDCLLQSMDDFVNVTVATFREVGGPTLDPDVLLKQALFTGVIVLFNMINGVPNCLKMVSAQQFANITSWRDPLIAGTIHGKSTHRTTCFVMNTGIRLIQEMGVFELLEDWIQSFIVKQFQWEAKTPAMIFGGA